MSTVLGNIELTGIFVLVLAFFFLHVRLQWWRTIFGVSTMLDTITFVLIITWLNLYPWFGIDVREHPALRATFWGVMMLRFGYRLSVLIIAQVRGYIYEQGRTGVSAADATGNEKRLVQTDNSAEAGQPVPSQDPSYVPKVSE